MCKYCEFQKWDWHQRNGIDISDEDSTENIFIGRAFIKDADEKRVRIFLFGEDGIISFTPKYCPMCGERINKDVCMPNL